jgi:hypothetical protein
VSPARYELGSDISEDGIRHSHRREKVKSFSEFFIKCIETQFVGITPRGNYFIIYNKRDYVYIRMTYKCDSH